MKIWTVANVVDQQPDMSTIVMIFEFWYRLNKSKYIKSKPGK